MKFQLESSNINFHIQKIKAIKEAIEMAIDNPDEALVSIWTREKEHPFEKSYSLLAAFTALFITHPLEIREAHYKMLRNEFGSKGLVDICDILSKKLQSRLPFPH